MVKTTSERAAAGRATKTSKGDARGFEQSAFDPTREVGIAESAVVSAEKRSAASTAGRAGKRSASSGAVRTSAAAADMTKAAKRPPSRRRGPPP